MAAKMSRAKKQGMKLGLQRAVKQMRMVHQTQKQAMKRMQTQMQQQI